VKYLNWILLRKPCKEYLAVRGAELPLLAVQKTDPNRSVLRMKISVDRYRSYEILYRTLQWRSKPLRCVGVNLSILVERPCFHYLCRMSSTGVKFELELIIQRCILRSTVPVLSVPASSYAETSIGGMICENGNTEPAKMIDGHVVWNKRVVTHFTDLEPPVPMIISMSVYRKSLFKQSFKLIGTAHLCVADLVSTINIGHVYSKVHLSVNKNVSTRGYLLVSTSMKVVLAKENPVYMVVATTGNYGEAVSRESPPIGSDQSRKLKKESKRSIALYVGYFNTVLVLVFISLLVGSVLSLAEELYTFGSIH